MFKKYKQALRVCIVKPNKDFAVVTAWGPREVDLGHSKVVVLWMIL